MKVFTASKNPAVLEAIELLEQGADPDQILLKEGDAFELLPCEQSTLRKARFTGVLLGHPAPPFVKLGKNVRYRLSDLLRWRDNAVKVVHANTAAAATC